MKMFLVDCETVDPSTLLDYNLEEGDYIYFVSKTRKSIDLEIFTKKNLHIASSLVEEECYTDIVNAYMGYMIGKNNDDSSIKFKIVTNDMTILCVAECLYGVCDLELITPECSITQDKPAKIIGENVISKEEVERYIKQKYNAEEILKIVNNYKTRKACYNHLIKFFGGKQGKNIYIKLHSLLMVKGRT